MKKDDKDMFEMRVKFSKNVEILNIIETAVQNHLQIIAFDHEQSIYFILTWNFNSNVE